LNCSLCVARRGLNFSDALLRGVSQKVLTDATLA
jgi:hypothetical protein